MMVKRPRLSYRAILEACNARCTNPKCRSKNNLTINHKIPLSQGGTNDPENLEILCERCHKKFHGTYYSKKLQK